jgi:hypothetical protein
LYEQQAKTQKPNRQAETEKQGLTSRVTALILLNDTMDRVTVPAGTEAKVAVGVAGNEP